MSDYLSCVLFGAGEYYAEVPQPPRGAMTIAVDGGLDHMRRLGLTPDAIIGDFDSVADDFAEYRDCGNIMRLPSEKDDTDMFAAVKLGWAHGARRFHIFGGLGGRLDHTLANLQLLAQVSRHGGIGFLHGDGTMVTALTDGTLSFPAWTPDAGAGVTVRTISVFAHSDLARHVSIHGLKYEVDDSPLRNMRALGVSNEFRTGMPASIAVGDGTLDIVYPAAAPEPQWWTDRGNEGPDALGAIDTHISKLLAKH